jgi:hypothetical protein
MVVGDQVNYVPDVKAHWNDADHRGQPFFEFVYDGGPNDGQVVPDVHASPRGFRVDRHGQLVNAKSARIRVGRSLAHMTATIEKLDGDKADLRIDPGNPMIAYLYPAVPYSKEPKSHTWHEREP